MLDFDFSVEHVLMFMIMIFLLYHLVNNCGCVKDGFSVEKNLIFQGRLSQKDLDTNCFVYPPSTGDCDYLCDKKFVYDTDNNVMIGCSWYAVGSEICKGCQSGYYKDTGYSDISLCSNGSNSSCPSCNDPSFYSKISGSKCDTSLQMCQECLKEDKIIWNNPNAQYRTTVDGDKKKINYKYNGSNILHSDIGCQNTDNFCKQNQNDCVSDLHTNVENDINNSGTQCSISDIKNKINDNSYIINKCKYDGTSIAQDDDIIDVYLNEKDYCNPDNKNWKCIRDIPKYCKGNKCTYDIHQKECVCKPPTVLLQDNTCGKPDCGYLTPGLCKKGLKCDPFIWGGITTYSCVKDED